MIGSFQGKSPRIGQDSYIAETAVLLGDVTLGRECTVLYGAVIRSDYQPIVIGDRSNIQDNAVLHVDIGAGLFIGNSVTVGHCAIVHGCTVGDGCLVGMHATLLSGCRIGENCLIAAGALVSGNMTIPPGSVVMGCPGRVVRSITEKDRSYMKLGMNEYIDFGRTMREFEENQK